MLGNWVRVTAASAKKWLLIGIAALVGAYVTLVVSLALIDAPGFGIGTYSRGLRVGELSNFSNQGHYWSLWLSRIGEGQLVLGQNSSTRWDFATSKRDIPEYQKFSGHVVAVEFTQSMWYAFRDSDYVATRISDVKPVNPPPCELANSGGTRKDGFKSGLLVKVSNKGYVFSTHEIQIQEAGGGNIITDMSILNDEMFECAKNWARTGRKVIVHYVMSTIRNPMDSDTRYDIHKIEAAQPLTN